MCIAIYKDPKVVSSWTGADQVGNSRFGQSDFQDASWASKYRIGCIQEQEVRPGDTGTFTLTFQIHQRFPAGQFREDITLASGPYWMAADGSYTQGGTGDEIGAAHIWSGFHVFGFLEEVTVQRAIDPNHIELTDGRKVEYIGVNTIAPGTCYYDEALKINQELTEGKKVLIHADPMSPVSQGEYMLRHIIAPAVPSMNDSSKSGSGYVNLYLLAKGFLYYSPNYDSHWNWIYETLQNDAKSKKVGGWGKCIATTSPTATPLVTTTPTSVVSRTATPFPTAFFTLVPTQSPTPTSLQSPTPITGYSHHISFDDCPPGSGYILTTNYSSEGVVFTDNYSDFSVTCNNQYVAPLSGSPLEPGAPKGITGTEFTFTTPTDKFGLILQSGTPFSITTRNSQRFKIITYDESGQIYSSQEKQTCSNGQTACFPELVSISADTKIIKRVQIISLQPYFYSFKHLYFN